MAFNPFYSSSPSDSGLLDGNDIPLPGGAPSGQRKGKDEAGVNVPDRFDYDAPQPNAPSAESLEESLREAPLPEGFLSRLRNFVGDL